MNDSNVIGRRWPKGPEGARFTMFPGYMERFNRSLTKEAVAGYVAVAKDYGMSPSELALAFVRSRRGTSVHSLTHTTFLCKPPAFKNVSCFFS